MGSCHPATVRSTSHSPAGTLIRPEHAHQDHSPLSPLPCSGNPHIQTQCSSVSWERVGETVQRGPSHQLWNLGLHCWIDRLLCEERIHYHYHHYRSNNHHHHYNSLHQEEALQNQARQEAEAGEEEGEETEEGTEKEAEGRG